jgi:integrase
VAAFADNKPKVKRKQVDVWNEVEARGFLKFVAEAKSRYYIAFHLSITSGARQGEVLGLRWMDCDLERKIISIRQSLSHDGKEFGLPKTESSIRSISIDNDTVEALKQHRKLIEREKELALSMYIDKDLVVCTNIGTQCHPRNLERAWKKLRNDAKMRKITYHDLRHTHASLLLKNSAHPKVVSERLGHSSIQITLDLYSHLFPNIQEDAATGLGQLLFPKNVEAEKEV